MTLEMKSLKWALTDKVYVPNNLSDMTGPGNNFEQFNLFKALLP